MNTLITGGTGFIGRQLVERLGGGDIVTRDPAKAAAHSWPAGTKLFAWRDQRTTLELPASYQPEAVVNLMGESIASRRWNSEFKERLRSSRIEGTQQLVAGLLASGRLPRVMVSASAIGYYGDRGDELLTESAAPGDDFLARLSIDWEAATRPLVEAGVR
ncbi:MAG: NAD-dependent epimerase/dehydratase family protein, partial [Planctomycetota bacterium]